MTDAKPVPRPARRCSRIFAWVAAALLLAGLPLALHGYSLWLATLPEHNPFDLQMEAPRALRLGGENVLRCTVLDRVQRAGVAGQTVEAWLRGADGQESRAATAVTGADGVAALAFAPALVQRGPNSLRIVAARAGSLRFTVPGERPLRILLTSDKPLYQPTQTIHLRAVVMDTGTGKPAAREETSFEVEDAKGNKVFRRGVPTSQFGIAALDFLLADEVNQGPFKLRARAGGIDTEKTVTVTRYVLPKFKVDVSTDASWYLAGSSVRGSVEAAYFFGKPVAGAAVKVTIARFIEQFEPVAEFTGKTDGAGRFEFTYEVRSGDFQGTPLDDGNAAMKIEARITDTADHVEAKTAMRTVAQQALRLRVVHESGVPVPNVENRYWIVAAYPDGSPARGTGKVGFPGRPASFTANEAGVALVSHVPDAGSTQYYNRSWVQVDMKDEQGRTGTYTFDPGRPTLRPDDRTSWYEANPARAARGADGPARFLVRTDRAFYQVGETAHVSLHAAEPGGRYCLDLVRGGQTVSTRLVKTEDRETAIDLDLDAAHAGTLTLSVYRLLPSGHWARDRRVLYVDQPRALDVAAVLDRETYKPGETAAIDFTVRTPDGKPEAAAISLSVVDEAVFALSENQPGLEKVYFSLEKELLEPKYQIKAAPVSLPALVRSGSPPPPPVQEAAAAGLAAIELPEMPEYRSSFDQRQEEFDQVRWQRRHRFDEFMSWVVTGLVIAGYALVAFGLGAYTGVRLVRAYGPAAGWGWWLGVPIGLWATLFLGAAISRRGEPVLLVLLGEGVVVLGVSIWSWTRKPRPDAPPVWLKASLAAGAAWVGIPLALTVFFFAAGGARNFKAATSSLDGGAPTLSLADRAAGTGAEVPTGGGPPTGAPASADARKAAVRVREYFPETLVWKPELITDEQGRARLTFPLADSITTWRMSAQAVSLLGRLGGLDTGIRVFQDFFVDLDLPVSLTQGDEVQVPLAVYNYLDEPQAVDLELEPRDWFEPLDPPKKRIELAAREVRSVRFALRARSFGEGKLTVFALGSRGFDDAIRRSIPVLPDGKPCEGAVANRLAGNAAETLEVPEQAIDGASRMWFKLYPGAFSQVVDGLDRMVRMPYG